MVGIYVITNVITGSQYVGQSRDIKRRIMEHKTPNASLRSKSRLFREDIKKFGMDQFRFEVLEECREEDLTEKEREWIQKLSPAYNVIMKDVSEEVRQKIRTTLQRRWQEKPEAEKKRIVETQLIGPKIGHAVSDETKDKLRAANLGKRHFAVLVVETGKTYRGIAECAEALGCCQATIRNQLHGRTKTAKGYHLERVETNRDECSGVGGRREPVEVRDISLR